MIPYETLAADAAYQSLGPRLLKSVEPVGTQVGKSVFVGPHAMPVYLTNDDKHLGLGAHLGAMSTSQPQNIELRITLDELIALDGSMISLADATSRSDKAAQAIGNVITGLATGITRQMRHYDATAEPQAYAAGITRYADAYYQAVTQAIRSASGV